MREVTGYPDPLYTPLRIAKAFTAACRIISDINEHLPTLCKLAQECERVTEFGVRTGTGSTIAFLAAQPSSLISWDLHPGAIVSPVISEYLAAGKLDEDGRWRVGRTFFQPRTGDTLAIPPIEETDLLFIDTYHTAKHLLAELVRHVDPVAMPVKKYLVFHDTISFGEVGEDGSTPGLRAAIRHFQKHHAFPQWELMHDFENCNGLVVLRAARAEEKNK